MGASFARAPPLAQARVLAQTVRKLAAAAKSSPPPRSASAASAASAGRDRRPWYTCAPVPALAASYVWQPLGDLADPTAFASPDMRAFTKVWQKQRVRLEELDVLDLFQERLARQWSIETGVLERLYDLSRGLTVTLIERGFHASLVGHGEATISGDRLVELLNDHRDGLSMVMDLIGGTRGLTVGWIKELHALLTRHQASCDAVTHSGQHVQVPLLRGAFKERPNNPLRPDGTIHEYCPPEHVPSEMDRLVAIYDSLPAELPEVRAAWLHHAFTQIHPFQDGNGRVARALASLEFIRAGLLPLLVERDDRDTRYFPALEAADRGDLQPLVTFFADCMSRVLLRASADADSLVSNKRDLTAVLRAGRRKVEARASQTASALAMERRRLHALASALRSRLGSLGALFSKEVPNTSVTVEGPPPGQESWYFREALVLARRNRYAISSAAPRSWVRLRIETEKNQTDVITVLNSISGPLMSAWALDVVLVHTPADKDEPELYHLDVGPLLLTSDEGESHQMSRLDSWLEQMSVQAAAQWIQFL